MNFNHQLEAIGSALLLIKRLPIHSVWALTCTNDDDAESPTVLNVYAPVEEWSYLQDALKLGKHLNDSHSGGSKFISFRQGTLLISLIEEDE